MSTKQELIDDLQDRLAFHRRETQKHRDELTDVRAERNAVRVELSEAQATIARLSEGCKGWRNAAIELRHALDDASDTIARLNDQLEAAATTPEPRPLIEPAPDDDLPTPQPVTLTLPDGTSVTFDAVVTR